MSRLLIPDIGLGAADGHAFCAPMTIGGVMFAAGHNDR
jgi:hypothetical protein